MSTAIQEWKQPEFEGKSLLPTIRSVQALTDPQGMVGRENIDVDDLIVPTIALLQGQSEAVTSGVGRPGKFQHSNSGEVFDGPIKGLIVHYHKSNAFFPQEKHDALYPEYAGKEACISRDAITGNKHGDCQECGICMNWMDDGRKPAGSHNHVFTLFTDRGPAIIRFGRSSQKAARKLVSDLGWGEKWWDYPVLIVPHSATKQLAGGKQSTYYHMTITFDRKEETPPEWRKAAAELWKQISGAHEEGKFGDEMETSELGEFD